MIGKQCSAEALYNLARQDIARNYFICYTMDNNQSYDKVWRFDSTVESASFDKPDMGVFLRKTGLIQIAIQPDLAVEAFSRPLKQLLSEITWQQANVSEKLMTAIIGMGFNVSLEKSATVSECKPENYKAMNRASIGLTFKPMHENDLEEVVEIYKNVFKSFARQAYMADKLKQGRGRGIVAYLGGQMVAVAQTDYETAESALIVGVATKRDQQGNGYGRAVMEALCTSLVNSGKTLYLQYDSAIAGNLYDSLGFKKIEQNYFIYNKTDL